MGAKGGKEVGSQSESLTSMQMVCANARIAGRADMCLRMPDVLLAAAR